MPAIVRALLSAVRNVGRHHESDCDVACVNNWKITFSILLVVESLVFGHIVVLIRAFSCVSPNRLLGLMRYGNALAGGIFLASALLHVIPEAIDLFVTGHHTHGGTADHPFPVVFTVILFSFYFLLILEYLLISSCQKKTVHSDETLTFDEDRSESIDIEVFGRTSMNLATAIGTRTENDEEPDEDAGKGYLSREFFSSLFMTLGVGAHSVLESIALGSSKEFRILLNLFIAIVAHRWATSAALGIRYAKLGLASGPVVMLIVFFSFIAPFGVGLGFLVTHKSDRFQSVIYSIAAGTFLYMGCSAILEQDSNRSRNVLGLFASAMAGSLLIVVVTAIIVSQETKHHH